MSTPLPMDVLQVIEDTKERLKALTNHVQDPAVHSCNDKDYVMDWHALLHILIDDIDKVFRTVIETVRKRFHVVVTESSTELDRLQAKLKRLFAHGGGKGTTAANSLPSYPAPTATTMINAMTAGGSFTPGLVGEVIHGILEAAQSAIDAESIVLFTSDGVDHHSSVTVNVSKPPAMRKAVNIGVVGQVFTSGIAMNLDMHEIDQHGGLRQKISKELGTDVRDAIYLPVCTPADSTKPIAVIVAFNKRNRGNKTATFHASDEVTLSHTAQMLGTILANPANVTFITTGIRFETNVLDLKTVKGPKGSVVDLPLEVLDHTPKKLIYRGGDKDALLKLTGPSLTALANPTTMIDVGNYVSQLDTAWLRTTEQYTRLQREEAKRLVRGRSGSGETNTNTNTNNSSIVRFPDVLLHPHPSCTEANEVSRNLMRALGTKKEPTTQSLASFLPTMIGDKTPNAPHPTPRAPQGRDPPGTNIRLRALMDLKEIRAEKDSTSTKKGGGGKTPRKAVFS